MDWFHSFQSGNDWFVGLGNALQHVVNSLDDPDVQCPSLVLFIGKHREASARTALYPKMTKCSSDALGQLFLDSRTRGEKHPILVASMDTTAQKRTHVLDGGRKGSVYRLEGSIEHARVKPSSVAERLVSKVALLFTDVVCLFLDDFPTHRDGLDLFEEWVGQWKSRSRMPIVILVTTEGCSHDDLSRISCLLNGRHVFMLSRITRPKSAKYEPLRHAILRSLGMARESRAASRMLFSAKHFTALFKLALEHEATSPDSEFNFVQATRRWNQIDGSFTHYVRTFLRLCKVNHSSEEFLLRYVASALLLDSMPRGMHRFAPNDIFNSLYNALCEDAFGQEYGTAASAMVNRLRAHYCNFYSDLERSNLFASELHRRNLENLFTDWSLFRSSQTCLYCLRRKPEHSLSCGHTFCDTCACIFGAKRPSVPYSYHLTTCILCRNSDNVTIFVKPPTAGARLLVLDGGGIRGAFTLQALRALDQHRNLPYPIYDDFDLALGTSSGGLIVLMFLLRRSIDDCIIMFRRLAKRAFPRRNWFGNNCLTKMFTIISSLLTDSTYGSTEMEKCVREAYENTLMFGNPTSEQGISGGKIAVTAMTVSNSRLCILSNYNGAGHRRKECGYKHFRPEDVDDELLIRDAARATSAAPSYFPAKFIRGAGYLQDGGAGKHNNPIDPAEWETKVIWDTTVDMAVSIGTGYSCDPVTPKSIPSRLTFRDRFLPRLLRLFNAALDAQSNWNDHLNRVDDDRRYKYFRVNVALEEDLALDDVERISDVENLASTFLRTYDFIDITQALFATAFFFELHQRPMEGKRNNKCKGSIRCRSPDTPALISRILTEYPAACFTTEDGTNLGHVSASNLCYTCGSYCVNVSFSVCHLEKDTSIFIRFNRLKMHRISGFPQKMSHFVESQLLDAAFGRPDHDTMEWNRECNCSRGKKRKRIDGVARKRSTRRRV